MSNEPLAAARNLYIRRWGEMGASWGISRTMAEIHALLYLAPEPLCTDDVMRHLEVSRGNASMNLRQLVNWGLVQRVHRRGDRKEYFQADTDVWQMFETISRERRRREVEPIVETIERCRTMVAEERERLSGPPRALADQYQRRFDEMLEFFEAMNLVANLIARAGPVGVRGLAQGLEDAASATPSGRPV
ncbi:MAG TPA: ArsR family transcriptional regulator [Phycisphaerae bacterium]|nr:ArsR family transcriptional regulator [Phycisphaerae bacterium]HNU45880.1 ArsR family transcriptional regulator [Phycisphaerae bacterium]